MRRTTVVGIAVALSLLIRIALLAMAPMPALGAYDAVLQADHIKDAGLPLTEDPHTWDGAQRSTSPLGHYLIAIIALFTTTETAALLATNLALALLPIPLSLLAKDITRNTNAVNIVTLASPFLPLLYATTHTAPLIAFGLPLLLLTLHYYIRVGKTPKQQIAFLASAILLAATHPIGLLLAATMGVTLLLLRIQKTRYSHAMGEATLFTALLMIWANAILYRNAIHHQGAGILWRQTPPPPADIALIAASIGPLILLVGGYAAYTYLKEEHNPAAHALVALVAVTALAVPLRLVTFQHAALIAGAGLLVLSAGGIDMLATARAKSRLHSLYSLAGALAIILFVATNITPALATGLAAQNDIPTQEDHTIRQTLLAAGSPKTAWQPRYGPFLRAAGIPTALSTDKSISPDSQQLLQDLESLDEENSEIGVLETLNQHNIYALIVPEDHDLPLSERCFTSLHTGTWEVYRIRCVVQ